MTGPEIAQAPRYGLDPIVVVVNNGGWQIFRPVVERTELLDRAAVAVRRAGARLGRRGLPRRRRVGEFRAALADGGAQQVASS